MNNRSVRLRLTVRSDLLPPETGSPESASGMKSAHKGARATPGTSLGFIENEVAETPTHAKHTHD